MPMCVIHTPCAIYPQFTYTDYAGLEITVNSSIASPFSRHIAIGNAGPTTALDSMGLKPTFRCHFLNICPSYKQQARKSFLSSHITPSGPLFSTKKYCLRARAGKPPFCHRHLCNLGPAFPFFTSVARRPNRR